MKQPIAWHEECLKNSRDSNERRRVRALADLNECARLEAECVFYERQIQEARRIKKDGFDRDRFLKGKP